ncbi:MAG: leucine--tRNA ligase [Phycisphaerae bacterium]|nr:leucine--tRNA ligase [Phycisphaerae bacterium]
MGDNEHTSDGSHNADGHNEGSHNSVGSYNFVAIEAKWQQHWLANKTFRTPQPGSPEFDANQPKFYVLDMFPYPSGVGLHVGHPLGYIATDIYARYQRMRGYNVLHPMGYDAFGLPAEQYAVEHGVPPRETTQKNIDNMRAQMQRLGLGYDWDRELATTDVEFYRWTQWIFLQLYNSWYDVNADAARPIAELIAKLENEQLYVDPNDQVVSAPTSRDIEAVVGLPLGLRKWHELTPKQQRTTIDHQRLAYLDEVPVNWCPALGTVLANEEVTNEGRSERGNHPVFRRPLRQWMMRITRYAERLERDLSLVNWPEAIKLMQRNWIGRSEGAEVEFEVAGVEEETIRVYTTRPDTLFGATYMVLAPEHELVPDVTTEAQQAAVEAYIESVRNKSDLDRTADTKEKTGVFTGGYAINPVNQQQIPIWIADYVLMGYGTGAIMAVPAHDTRDFEFATRFNLPIIQVVEPPAGDDWRGFTGDGIAVNSGKFNGLTTPEFKKRITEWLEAEELGRGAVNYKLRDWLFSRQRYWGEPFPIVHDAKTGDIYPLDASELPLELPAVADYRPQASDDPEAPPAPPLGRATDWANVRGYITETGSVITLKPGQSNQSVPAGVEIREFRRELNTMPQWAGSCWYYLRYLDNKNRDALVDSAVEQYWMLRDEGDAQQAANGGVDLYVGGAEHAVLHLLYSRFWHKVLFDLGIVSTPEPFGRLFNQGYIQAYAYQDGRGMYVSVEDVEERGEGKDVKFFQKTTGEKLSRSLGKMGKSLKNAVAPDDICHGFGADTLRAYEMYMGPLEASKPWSTRDIIGLHRFLQSVWKRFVAEDGSLKVVDVPAEDSLRRLLHRTIKRVTNDMEGLRFNTAIAGLIEMNNALKGDRLSREIAEPFVKLLSPIAPHIAEELWERMRSTGMASGTTSRAASSGVSNASISAESWPSYDEALTVEAEIEIPVQINGKVRGRVTLPAADAKDEARMQQAALADEKVAQELAGKTVRKVVCIPGRMVNIVVG